MSSTPRRIEGRTARIGVGSSHRTIGPAVESQRIGADGLGRSASAIVSFIGNRPESSRREGFGNVGLP
jgi:hypothetical protein